MINLSAQKMESFKAFLKDIHVFKDIIPTLRCCSLASTSVEDNMLFINPDKWVDYFKIDPLKDEPLSAKEKSVLLHEAGHAINKHILPYKPIEEWDVEHKNMIENLRVKHEVEAQTWAMNYALDNNWQDVYNESVFYILLFMAKEKREANLAAKRLVAYYRMADVVIEDIKKCTHKNFNPDVLNLVNVVEDAKKSLTFI